MNDILKKLSVLLTEKRLNHSIGVAQSAIKLARIYGVDERKAEMAGILHDCAKCLNRQEVLEYVEKYSVELDDIEKEEIQLAHGKIGVIVAKKLFNITDNDILSAIKYHTTGKENMSVLEKIIYLADYIEPGRTYEGVEKLRKKSYENLNEALLLSFDNTIKYVIDLKRIIHPRTIRARNYILDELNKMR